MKNGAQALSQFRPWVDSNPTAQMQASIFTTKLPHEFISKELLDPARLGIAAAACLVMQNHGINPKEKRDRIRRMAIHGNGLAGEANTNRMLTQIDAFMVADPGFLANLQKYKCNMSVRYFIKCVDLNSLFAMVVSSCNDSIFLSMLATQQVHQSWAVWEDEIGIPQHSIIEEVEKRVSNAGYGLRAFAMMYAQHYLAIADGFATLDEALQAWGQPAATSTPATTTAASTSLTSNNGVTTAMNATTSTITINAAVKPIIDGVLQSSGTGLTIDSIIEQLNAKTELEGKLKATDKEIDDLKIKLAQARNAASSSMSATIQPSAQGIPSGKVEMQRAGKVFKELNGMKLDVPMFVWDHAHPDVPAIDDNYIFRKEMLLKAVRCLARGENFWLQGHTGSGKTTFVEQIAARLGWPVLRVAFDSNVDRSELVGRMQLVPDGKGGTASEWLPGALERAMKGGYILLCDELDAGHPNALYTLQPILEGKALTLLEDGGRMVHRTPAFRICATGNTTGNGDPSGMYPACRILSAATLDRFPEFIHVPYMTIDEERNLLSRVAPTLNKKLTEQLAKFSEEMRQAFVRLETPISYSPRRSMSFARQVEDLMAIGISDQPTAISMAFRSKLYDAAPDEHRQRITEIANNVFAGGINLNVSI